MLYLTHAPSPELAPFVEYLWVVSDAPRHSYERIVPSGTVELVINLYQDEIRVYREAELGRCSRFSGMVVSGPYSRFFSIDTAEHALTMGVHFKPGGAVPFLGMPARDLSDRHVDLASIWREAHPLRERLCESRPHEERFRLLDDALRAALRAPRQHPVVRFALARLPRPGARVDEIAREAGMSHRRFIELFDSEVGMTPKLYLRVVRFQQAKQHLESPAARAVDLAPECGYFDQSHLIRDFLAFSGLTPSAYRMQAQARQVKENHVAFG